MVMKPASQTSGTSVVNQYHRRPGHRVNAAEALLCAEPWALNAVTVAI
jgi:hypothetical protein